MAESLITPKATPKLISPPKPTAILLVDILARRVGRIVRPKGEEPWEAELLLVRSAGKFYLVELPLHGLPRPVRNNVPMSSHYLEVARPFDSLEQAQEVYNRVAQ